MLQKLYTKFVNNCVGKNVQNYEKKQVIWIKIIIALLLYLSTVIIQSKSTSSNGVDGILAQFQVIISIYLVLSAKKTGYLIALIANLLNSMSVIRFFLNGNVDAAPGIIVPLGTIFTISILSLFSRHLHSKILELTINKEELSTLYEEALATEEVVLQQNEQLIAYTQTMRENEDKLNYLAFFDVLTELPNRKMIINRLDLLINLSTSQTMQFVTVFIDLDNFKRINDSMGHHSGDLLLLAVALRLKVLIHPDDMLGRLGGDEFALIIQRQLKEEEIFEYVESLRVALLAPFTIERTEVSISASIGISIYPQNGENSIELLKCADTAMYKSKDSGKNAVQFFSKDMKDEILKNIEFENRLLSAIHKDEIFLVFQPQYTASSKRLKGFEALIRWQSPELGLVSPMKLISVAESTGFIISLGEWILRTACKIFKSIQSTYHGDLILSVNISPLQIIDPSFLEMIKSVLKETGFSGKCLELEVTESIFISSMEYVVVVLNKLKKIGIRIALDDFGTGYSSLSYLQMLPIDTLKIDKSFIDRISSRTTDQQIVGSIISLVHGMSISVVAEGVETEVQLEYLKSHECDLIQGFLWGKPLNERDLNQLVRQIP